MVQSRHTGRRKQRRKHEVYMVPDSCGCQGQPKEATPNVITVQKVSKYTLCGP